MIKVRYTHYRVFDILCSKRAVNDLKKHVNGPPARRCVKHIIILVTSRNKWTRRTHETNRQNISMRANSADKWRAAWFCFKNIPTWCRLGAWWRRSHASGRHNTTQSLTIYIVAFAALYLYKLFQQRDLTVVFCMVKFQTGWPRFCVDISCCTPSYKILLPTWMWVLVVK